MRYFIGPDSGELLKVVGNKVAYYWENSAWVECHYLTVAQVLLFTEFN